MSMTPRPCPKCHRPRVRPLTQRGVVEWCWRVLHWYPFRCQVCGHRFRRSRLG